MSVAGNFVVCTNAFCRNCAVSIEIAIVYVVGENSIAIVAGANLLLSEQDILNAETLIASSRVLICQLEICKSVTFAALELAHKHGGVYELLCAVMILLV